MDKIGYDTTYVNKNTRAGKDGKKIICPQCDKSATVYHFSWSALECNGCHSDIEKNAWIVSPKKRTYSFTLNDEYMFQARELPVIQDGERHYYSIGSRELCDILFNILVEFKCRGTLGWTLKQIERRTR